MRNFLLTYIDRLDCTFEWFETEEDMFDFIKENKLESEQLIDAIEIFQCRDIKLED